MATFGEGDEKQHDVLQAADACIYEVRRVLNVVKRQWPGPTRKQYAMLREANRIGIIETAEKSHLQEIVATHKPGEPFKLDAIMQHVFHEDVKFTI